MRTKPVAGVIEEYFILAGRQAAQATCYKARCGTVIVKNNEIIGTGFNAPPKQDESQRKCSQDFDMDVKPKYDKTCCIHAEWNAILSALKNNPDKIEGSSLYFMRIDENGNFTGAGQPFCTVCSRLSLESGIKEFVLYHDEQAQFYGTHEYNLASYVPYELTSG